MTRSLDMCIFSSFCFFFLFAGLRGKLQFSAGFWLFLMSVCGVRCVVVASLLICPQSVCCFPASGAAAFLCVRHPFVIKKKHPLQQHLIFNLISNHFPSSLIFFFTAICALKAVAMHLTTNGFF